MSEESALASQPSSEPSLKGEQEVKEVAFDEFITRSGDDYVKSGGHAEATLHEVVHFKLPEAWVSDNIEPLIDDNKAGLFNTLARAGFSESLARELIPVIEPYASRLIQDKATTEENAHRVVAFFSEAVARMKTMDETSDHAEPFEAEAQAPPLTIPEGEVPRYQGKKKSGEIYEFLLAVYAHTEGATPLTLDYIKKNDLAALIAYRNRQRSAPVPDLLRVLAADGRGSRQKDVLRKHGVDVHTPQGVAGAKKLMSAISNHLYPR